MARATLQRGSKGSAVSELQTILNKSGYNLSVDGDFGEKTEAAVRDYQTKNGLGVDGIVGVNTWGKLAPEVKVESPKFEYQQFTPDPFTKSEDLVATEGESRAAEDAVANYGDFSWDKQGEYDDLYKKYTGRDPFSYDFNADALYQQYKDMYMQQGQMAMQDAIGQAAAMTGGYGNSYAASVGNQAYQQSLQQLNNVIPELYQLAYSRYQQEGQDMLSALGLLEGDRAFDYGLYTDKYGRLVSDRGYYGDKANNLYGREYGEYMDGVGISQSEHQAAQGYEYQTGRDSVADQQWQATFDEGIRQWEATQNATGTDSPSGGGGGYKVATDPTGKPFITDETGKPVETEKEVPAYVYSKAETFESQAALDDYLEGLVASGVIDRDQAFAIMAKYDDPYEQFIKDENGNDTDVYSYGAMVKSTSGWSVVDYGGANLFGIDRDAKVKAPNGETITLANLKKKLEAEGMDSNAARKAIKALQQNLGISSNWLFGW